MICPALPGICQDIRVMGNLSKFWGRKAGCRALKTIDDRDKVEKWVFSWWLDMWTLPCRTSSPVYSYQSFKGYPGDASSHGKSSLSPPLSNVIMWSPCVNLQVEWELIHEPQSASHPWPAQPLIHAGCVPTCLNISHLNRMEWTLIILKFDSL